MKLCEKCQSNNQVCGKCKTKEKNRVRCEKWRIKNKERKKQSDRDYREKNRDKILKQLSDYYYSNKEELLKNQKEYYELNKGRYAKTHKKYFDKNRDKILKYQKDYANKKRKTDTTFYLNSNMRCSINNSLRNKNLEKGGQKWTSIVGYNAKDLKIHLESKFTDGMSWEKMMNGEIHIDHIIPQSSFKFTSIDDNEFKKCWSLGNLQPLWAKDNLKKGKKLIKFNP